jgi:hypothetical protein
MLVFQIWHRVRSCNPYRVDFDLANCHFDFKATKEQFKLALIELHERGVGRVAFDRYGFAIVSVR